MVLGPEVEDDRVTLGSLDAVGLEDNASRLVADGYDVLGCHGRTSHGRSSEDGGEMHYGCGFGCVGLGRD